MEKLISTIFEISFFFSIKITSSTCSDECFFLFVDYNRSIEKTSQFEFGDLLVTRFIFTESRNFSTFEKL